MSLIDYQDYQYEPTDLDDELFLSQAPLEILLSSIITQFEEPFENRKKDFVQSFITKYEYSKENMYDEDEDMEELERYHDKFLAFLENIFQEKLGVGFSEIDDINEEDQHEIVHLTYRFFLKNIKKNFVNIVWNYIQDNQKEIQNSFEKKKDVTSLTFKAEIDDEYDITILSNLIQIIQNVFDMLYEEEDVDKFFEMCRADEPILELAFVEDCYEKMKLTGNFVTRYIDMVDDEFKFEIQSKIRSRILKKYSKRTKKNDIQETQEEENTETDTTNIDEE